MTTIAPFIRDISLTLTAAGAVVLFAKRLSIPLVLGYIIAGILVGPHLQVFPSVAEVDQLRILSELGIIFLLFGLGLEFSIRKLKKIGIAPIIIGVLEVSLMTTIGRLVAKGIGLHGSAAWAIGFLIAISSTGVIVKIFQEKKLTNFFFAQTVVGVLIVEDLFAIVFLLVLSIFADQPSALSAVNAAALPISAEPLSQILYRQFALLFGISTVWLLLGTLFLPMLIRRIHKLLSDEVVVITSLGLCLGMSLVAGTLGISSALAAFLTGSVVAETTEHERVFRLTQPIRDFFAAIFFVAVGMLLETESLLVHWRVILLLSAVVIVGKFLSILLASLLTGRSFDDGIKSALSMIQIGEFSVVMVTLATGQHILTPEWQGIIIAVSSLSILVTALVFKNHHVVSSVIVSIVPVPLRNIQRRYRARLSRTELVSDDYASLVARVRTVALNGVIALAIFLVTKFVFIDEASPEHYEDVLYLIGASILASPFLVAMTRLSDLPKTTAFSSANRISLIQLFALIGTLFFYILVSLLVLPDIRALLAIAATVMVLLIIFNRSLHRANVWVFKNLHEHKPSAASGALPVGPWDEHLHAFTIDPFSVAVEQTLSDLDLRNRFGINVILHQRGSHKTVAPPGDTKMYPGDTILVLGFDEGIQKLDDYLTPLNPHDSEKELEEGFTLSSVELQPKSAWDGRALGELDLHTSVKGVIVAVERGGTRILTPKSDFILAAHDFVWLVMDKSRLQILDMFSRTLA